MNKKINQIPHVHYDDVQVKQFDNKLVDFRWQRFMNNDKQKYKQCYNSFRSGKGVAAKIKDSNNYIIFTPTTVKKSSTSKNLPELPVDWYKYIKILNALDF